MRTCLYRSNELLCLAWVRVNWYRQGLGAQAELVNNRNFT